MFRLELTLTGTENHISFVLGTLCLKPQGNFHFKRRAHLPGFIHGKSGQRIEFLLSAAWLVFGFSIVINGPILKEVL